MKIVHVVGWYYPDFIGGTEGYVAGLSARLRAQGHRVWVAAPNQGATGESTYEHAGIPVYRYPTPLTPSRDECQGRSAVRGTEQLQAWLSRLRPDVVHFHSFTTGIGLPELRAARDAGARVVVTNHLGSLGFICQRGTLMRWGEELCDGIAEPVKCAACELQHMGVPKPVASVLAAVGDQAGEAARLLPASLGSALGMPALIRHNQRQQRDMLALVDRFVLLNEWAMRVVVANGAPADKLELNRLGVSHRITRKPAPDRRPTTAPVKIGYLGRLVAIKGVFDLARAFKSLPSDAAMTLEFRGPIHDEETRSVSARLREMLSDDPRVRFADPVPPEKASELLSEYDVLCCPSVWFENGPTVALEAQAAGTPVIGTRIGAMAEFIRDDVDGRLTEPGDWRELGVILAEIAANPAGTVDRWRAALPVVRTMDDVSADYLTLYTSLPVREKAPDDCTDDERSHESLSQAHRAARSLPGDPLLVPGS